MIKHFLTKKSIYVFLFFYVLFAMLTIVFFNGTGDAGDSIGHYLYAKYAPVVPHQIAATLLFYGYSRSKILLFAKFLNELPNILR